MSHNVQSLNLQSLSQGISASLTSHISDPFGPQPRCNFCISPCKSSKQIPGRIEDAFTSWRARHVPGGWPGLQGSQSRVENIR